MALAVTALAGAPVVGSVSSSTVAFTASIDASESAVNMGTLAAIDPVAGATEAAP